MMQMSDLMDRLEKERLTLALAAVETVLPFQAYVELASQAVGISRTLRLMEEMQEAEMERQEKEI